MTRFDKETILDILYQSDTGLTAQAFIKEIKNRSGLSLRRARSLLNRLVQEQELAYHYRFGTTYVEKSFLKPVQISPHFILTPHTIEAEISEKKTGCDCKRIIIEPGISFGSGQHPTTRLCLEAIDVGFSEKIIRPDTGSEGVDIGTGSGVLAIAMVLSGLGTCLAYEIDPVSIHEAGKNVAANQLSHTVRVAGERFTAFESRYAVISANLRYPTLKLLSGGICSSLKEKGVAVLSGIRPWEEQGLLDCYRENGLTPVWQKDKKKWSGVMLVKGI